MDDRIPFLDPLTKAGVRASWVERIHEVDTAIEREQAIQRLRPFHERAVEQLGGELSSFWLCEQVHGNVVTRVFGKADGSFVSNADGLVTNDPDSILGIYVADCGAIYVADPVKKAVGLVHSGRVGTEKNILRETVCLMEDEYQSRAEDLLIVLAPCIRPPVYEVDFAAKIREQALDSGVREANYFDSEICTSSDLSRFYSYRVEKGMTGRMLALIAL